MDFFNNIMDKLSRYEFNDFFPLNNRPSATKDVLIIVGIYLAAAIVMGLLITLLGRIFILGVIIKIIGFIVCAYCLLGLVAALLKYMKYN